MNVPRPEQRKTKNSKRRFRLAVLAILSILLTSTAKSADTGLSPDTPTKSEAVQRATAWLVGQQLKDGTWPGRGLANTALSTLSVADGAGPFWCGEPFLNSIRRGRRAMLERLNSDLDVCFQSDPIGFSVAVYSLAATPPVEGEEEPSRCLDKAVETICRWQRDDGAWRFDSEVADARSDAFLTAWAVLALESGFRGGISSEQCRKALARYSRTWSGRPQTSSESDCGDADVLRGGLSAHARDLISGTQDKSLSEFIEFFFDSNGAPTAGGENLAFEFQLPFLLRAMASSCSANEYKRLVARADRLARLQISDSTMVPPDANRPLGLGYWQSSDGDEYRIGPNSRFPRREISRSHDEDDNLSHRVQDTCFGILQFAQLWQIRLLPSIPRVTIPKNETKDSTEISRPQDNSEEKPIGKIRQRR